MGIERWFGQPVFALGAAFRKALGATPAQELQPDFLLFGLGRSGTSLLMAMLDAHPNITVVPDTGMLRALRAGVLSSVLKWVRRRGRGTYVTAYERFASTVRGRALMADLVGEKSPTNIEFILAAAAAWPETKFVEIRRDPRSILSSRKRAAWSRGRSVLANLVAMRTHSRLGQLQSCILRERYLVASYEALLDDPERELAKVVDFLGVDMSADMLRFSEHAGGLVRPDEPWKARILQPIDRDRLHVWKSHLTERERELVELTFSVDSPSVRDFASMRGVTAALVRIISSLIAVLVCCASLLLFLRVFEAEISEDAV